MGIDLGQVETAKHDIRRDEKAGESHGQLIVNVGANLAPPHSFRHFFDEKVARAEEEQEREENDRMRTSGLRGGGDAAEHQDKLLQRGIFVAAAKTAQPVVAALQSAPISGHRFDIGVPVSAKFRM